MPSNDSRKKHSIWMLLVVLGLLGVFGFIALVVMLAIFAPRNVPFTNKPVAIVKIEGAIFDSEETLRELQEDADDEDIKAVVLRIDSPGGAVGPSQEIFRQVLKLKQAGKKVVVSMGTVAASGGYYIASAADKIVASPGTITGSIGVIMENFGVEELAKTLRVEPRVIKSGKLKDVGSPFRPMTEDEKSFLQALSDDMYAQFTGDVAEQRKIPLEKLREIAEGKVYSGSQAQALGLVDELGNLYDAIDLAKKIAGLPKQAGVLWPRKPGALESFFGNEAEGRSLLDRFVTKWGASLPLWFFVGARPGMVL